MWTLVVSSMPTQYAVLTSSSTYNKPTTIFRSARKRFLIPIAVFTLLAGCIKGDTTIPPDPAGANAAQGNVTGQNGGISMTKAATRLAPVAGSKQEGVFDDL